MSHDHQYRIGPAYEQVRSGRTKVGELIRTLDVP
jgi:hypothetical protein